MKICIVIGLVLAATMPAIAATVFEGKLAILVTRGNETNALLYTVGPDHLRIEVTDSTTPHAINLVDLKSGAVTLVFPHNRTFARLKPAAANGPAPFSLPPGIGPQSAIPSRGAFANPRTNSSPNPSAMPSLPIPATGLPSGIGPQSIPPGVPGGASAANPVSIVPLGTPVMPNMPLPPAGLPPGIGPQAAGAGGGPTLPSMPASPAGMGVGPSGLPGGMPPMPMMPMRGGKADLQATTNTMTIHGFPCMRYDIEQRGEKWEIWTTDKLFPFRAYLRDQPPRSGPRTIEDRWPQILKERKLFPLRATLRPDNGAERFRFEVKSITPDRVTDEKLFQPPTDYHELNPLPF